MDFRTDLALERHEELRCTPTDGIESQIYEKSGVTFTKIKVTDARGEQSLGKPIGTYITAEIPSLADQSPESVLG